jgi:hypothetical protein
MSKQLDPFLVQVRDVVRLAVREPPGHAAEGVHPEPWQYGQPLSVLKSLGRGQSIAYALVRSVETGKKTAVVQWLRRTDAQTTLSDGTIMSVWALRPVKLVSCRRKGRGRLRTVEMVEMVESEWDSESGGSGDSESDNDEGGSERAGRNDAANGGGPEAFALKTVSWDGIIDRVGDVLRAETDEDGRAIDGGPLFCFKELPPVRRR